MPDVIGTRGVYQDGETTQRMLRTKRSIKAKISIFGAKTRAQMYEQRIKMQRLLALGRCFDAERGEMGRIVYENDAGRWWAYAIPETTPTDGARFKDNLRDISMNFRCDSAYLTEFERKQSVLQMGAGGFALPFSLPVRFGTAQFESICQNDGAVKAYTQISVYGSGETPTIMNSTTGAVLSISRQIATGEVLVINTDPERLNVTLVHVDGTSENAFGYLNAQHAVTGFYLKPGRNEIHYLPSMPSQSSRVVIAWQDRLEGV